MKQLKLFDSKKGLPSPIASEEEVTTSKPEDTHTPTQSETRRNYLKLQADMFKHFYTGRESTPSDGKKSISNNSEPLGDEETGERDLTNEKRNTPSPEQHDGEVGCQANIYTSMSSHNTDSLN